MYRSPMRDVKRRLIVFRRQNKKPLTETQRLKMNSRIDELLHQKPEEITFPTGQPENSVLIEPEPPSSRKMYSTKDDVSTLIYNDASTGSSWGKTPGVYAPYGAGLDVLYDSVVRIARKNATTFEHVIKELHRQLPGVERRRREQLEAIVRNPLFEYLRVEALAQDLTTTPAVLRDVEECVMREAQKPPDKVKKVPSNEERNLEILYIKSKRPLAQGFPMTTVQEALELSYGTAERFEFRWKYEEKKNRQS